MTKSKRKSAALPEHTTLIAQEAVTSVAPQNVERIEQILALPDPPARSVFSAPMPLAEIVAILKRNRLYTNENTSAIRVNEWLVKKNSGLLGWGHPNERGGHTEYKVMLGGAFDEIREAFGAQGYHGT